MKDLTTDINFDIKSVKNIFTLSIVFIVIEFLFLICSLDDDDFGSLVEPMKEKDRIDMQEKSTEKVDVQDEVIQERYYSLFLFGE